MVNDVQKVAKSVLGESKGFGPKGKEFWWQDDSVEQKIKYKRECFKALHLDNNVGNWEKYQSTKIKTKKAISKTIFKAFEGFYEALRTKNREWQIFKLAKGKERKIRDLDQVKYIKDKKGKVLVVNGDIKER